MGAIFRFKQFSVDQGNCAMKINTDGVLLGGLAKVPHARYILDIGTGTGVIAMMLAQSHPEAKVDAVEIDAEASLQATKNFKQSIFGSRMSAFSGSFMELQPKQSYDLIVSNPPFYTNSLHNPDPRKKLAKHTDHLFFENLLDFVAQHLSEKGQFLCVLPTLLADELTTVMLPERSVYLQKAVIIRSYVDEEPIRKILWIGKEERSIQTEDLHIYQRKGIYSERYKEILKPYFLAF